MATALPKLQDQNDLILAGAADPVARSVTDAARAAANSRDLGAGTGRAALPNQTFQQVPNAAANVAAATQINRDLTASPGVPNATFQRVPNAAANVAAATQIRRDTVPGVPMGGDGPTSFTAERGSAGMRNPTFERLPAPTPAFERVPVPASVGAAAAPAPQEPQVGLGQRILNALTPDRVLKGERGTAPGVDLEIVAGKAVDTAGEAVFGSDYMRERTQDRTRIDPFAYRAPSVAGAPTAQAQAGAPAPAVAQRAVAPTAPAVPATTPAAAPAQPAPTLTTTAPASRAAAPRPTTAPDTSGRVLVGNDRGTPTFGDTAGLSGGAVPIVGSYNPSPAGLPQGGAPSPEYWRDQLRMLNERDAQQSRENDAANLTRRSQEAITSAEQRREDLLKKAMEIGSQKGSRHNRALIAQLVSAANAAGAAGAPQAQALYAPGSDQVRSGVTERGQNIDRDTRTADTAVRREALGVQREGNALQYGLGMTRVGADLTNAELTAGVQARGQDLTSLTYADRLAQDRANAEAQRAHDMDVAAMRERTAVLAQNGQVLQNGDILYPDGTLYNARTGQYEQKRRVPAKP